MKKLLCLASLLISANCFAQDPINLSNLFSSTLPLEKKLIQVDELGGAELFIFSSNLETDLVEKEELKALNRALTSNGIEVPSISHYHWQHLSDSNLLETAYIPEMKIGFSQSLNGSSSSFYSVGVALIRPSENSFAWNNTAQTLSGDNDSRSTFLSLSLHSRF